jgi:hypothetical protein
MPFPELSNEQRRQLIDAQQAYSTWRPASNELASMGTLRSQTSKGRRYVYEVHGNVRKSLGRETRALLQKKAEHAARRTALIRSVKALDRRLRDMAPVNRALGLGRMPTIAARIVRALDREGLLGRHIIVAGTNALYAYEAATGTVLPREHVATTDADLLWDTNEPLLLAATGVRREGIMGILRRVDHSFVADYGFNATNADGYIVDLLCPETDDIPTMGEEADLAATPMEGVNWLLEAPRFEQIIIGEDGRPFRIVVPEPRTFALHKLWVSKRDSRNPLKRPRDVSHARVVAELVQTYLRQPFSVKDMPWLPKVLTAMIKELKGARQKKKTG